MLAAVHQVRKLDDRTVVIITRRPQPVLIRMLALVSIIPAGFQPERDIRGTGPYMMTRYTPRQELSAEYFPQYHGPAPEFQAVTWRFIVDDRQRAQALIDGRIDMDTDLAAADEERVKWQNHLAVATWHGSSVTCLNLDVRGEPRTNPLADRRVRQAISLAINRQEIVDNVYPNYATVATQLIPPSVVGFAPDLPAIRHDAAAARALLRAAGYGDGLALTLDLSESAMAEGQLMRRQLGEAGMRIPTGSCDWSELYPRVSRSGVPFFPGGLHLQFRRRRRAVQQPVAQPQRRRRVQRRKRGVTRNPELDRLVEAADREFDPRRRQELLRGGGHALVMADLPYIPMHTRSHCYGLRQDLLWQPRADSTVQIREIGRRR